MLKTITLCNTVDFSLGAVITGTIEELSIYDSMPHIEGAFDNLIYRYDPVTNSAVIRDEPLVRKPMLHELRNKRDELLENFRWTIMPDSPLSETNKAEWLAWLKCLQNLLRDFTPETNIEWPVKPGYEYA